MSGDQDKLYEFQTTVRVPLEMLLSLLDKEHFHAAKEMIVHVRGCTNRYEATLADVEVEVEETAESSGRNVKGATGAGTSGGKAKANKNAEQGL